MAHSSFKDGAGRVLVTCPRSYGKYENLTLTGTSDSQPSALSTASQLLGWTLE